MPRFGYASIDLPDRPLGELDARDAHDALAQLAARGIDPQRVTLTAIAEPMADMGAKTGERLDARTLSADDAAELGTHLVGLAQSQLPLPEGLRALAEEAHSRRTARALCDLAERLERGMALDVAIGQLQRRLPGVLAGLVAAGATNRRVAGVLMEYLDYQRRLAQLYRETRVSCIYPLCVLGLSVVVLFFFAFVLVTPAVQLLREFDAQMPLSTRFLAALGHLALPLLACALATIAMLWLLVRWALPSAARHRWCKRIPFFGPLWRWMTLGEWAKQLALLLEAALPLPKALRLVADTLADTDLAESSILAAEAIERGSSLGAAVAMFSQFPASLGPMLVWADETRQLPEILHAAAGLCEIRARRQVTLIELLLPAIVFLFVAWGVVFVLSSLVAPFFSIIQALTTIVW